MLTEISDSDATQEMPQIKPSDVTLSEVGTKLDLARAYIDMGDPDGAKSILEEVIEEGDDAQKKEARQLIDGLE
jgi:pilus assembly protein FimV